MKIFMKSAGVKKINLKFVVFSFIKIDKCGDPRVCRVLNFENMSKLSFMCSLKYYEL
jgi:hypothetical protein